MFTFHLTACGTEANLQHCLWYGVVQDMKHSAPCNFHLNSYTACGLVWYRRWANLSLNSNPHILNTIEHNIAEPFGFASSNINRRFSFVDRKKSKVQLPHLQTSSDGVVQDMHGEPCLSFTSDPHSLWYGVVQDMKHCEPCLSFTSNPHSLWYSVVQTVSHVYLSPQTHTACGMVWYRTWSTVSHVYLSPPTHTACGVVWYRRWAMFIFHLKPTQPVVWCGTEHEARWAMFIFHLQPTQPVVWCGTDDEPCLSFTSNPHSMWCGVVQDMKS